MHLFNSLNVFSFSSLNMLKTVVFKDLNSTSGPKLSHFPWMEYESHSPCKWIMLLFLSTSNDFLLLLKTRQCWKYAVMTLILLKFWGLSFPSDKQLICLDFSFLACSCSPFYLVTLTITLLFSLALWGSLPYLWSLMVRWQFGQNL